MMLPKQNNYKVGIYVRLSRDDERVGESLSIENQKKMLNSYVNERPEWNLVDIYEDDGISGTTFDRPGVQRLLEDAKSGKINLILCKDLSRFGRNYIQVGHYIDYIFPSFNIRFIAVGDNVDTLDRNSSAMDMMPIMNLFNEWHAANTSKKIRSVFASNAKEGKYIASFASYGYIKGDDENHTPIIDEPAAEIVRKIFDMRATGISPSQIAKKLNAEKILIPSDYQAQLYNRANPYITTTHCWSGGMVRRILDNQIYIGNLVQQKYTCVSFKHHKLIRKGEDEWITVFNNHQPIISKEVWDKCKEIDKCASHGKITKKGVVLPLSGFMYCADCGAKIKQNGHSKNKKTGEVNYFYTCGTYTRVGKDVCSSHYISQKKIEKLIIADIRSKINFVIDDEETAKAEFMNHKNAIAEKQRNLDTQELKKCDNRLAELKKLIHNVYEDKLLGRMPEELCIESLNEYMAEQKELLQKREALMAALEQNSKDLYEVDEFIKRLKKYAGIDSLTREICLDLIEYIVIGEKPENNEPRSIEIYYKLLDERLSDSRNILLN